MLTSIKGTFAPYALVELEAGESVVSESGALSFTMKTFVLKPLYRADGPKV